MRRIWLFAAGVTLASCVYLDPLPGSQVTLQGTSWSLQSIDGEEHTRTSLRVSFLSLDDALIETPCQTIKSGLIVDTDGSGLGFLEPVIRTPRPCVPDQSGADAEVIEAILTTGEWNVVSRDVIELVGDQRLRMRREQFDPQAS
jgi:hypothetical protein